MSPKNLSVCRFCLFRDAILALLSLHRGREATLHIPDRPVCLSSPYLAPGCTYPADELLSRLRGRDELAQCLESWVGQT